MSDYRDPQNKGGVLGGEKFKMRNFENFSRNNEKNDSGAPSECNVSQSKGLPNRMTVQTSSTT